MVQSHSKNCRIDLASNYMHLSEHLCMIAWIYLNKDTMLPHHFPKHVSQQLCNCRKNCSKCLIHGPAFYTFSNFQVIQKLTLEILYHYRITETVHLVLCRMDWESGIVFIQNGWIWSQNCSSLLHITTDPLHFKYF